MSKADYATPRRQLIANDLDTMSDDPTTYAALITSHVEQHAAMAMFPRKSMIASRSLGGSMSATAGTSAGSTWHITAEAETAFSWVRLIYESIEAGSIVITKAAIGTSNGTTAYPATTDGTLTSVTFAGGAAKGTIPAVVGTNQPGVLYSDWIQLQSLARTDGGTYPLLIARTYFAAPDGSGAGTGYSYRSPTGLNTTWAADTSNRVWKSSLQTVDGIATPSNFTQTATRADYVLAGFQTISEKQVATVAFCGDSVSAGVKTVADITGSGYLACRDVSASTYPVTPLVWAYGGSTPTQYQARAVAQLANAKPTVAFYPVSSVNAPVSSQAVADSHFGLAMYFVQQCLDNNVVPVLETCVPQNRGSTGADIYRKALNDRIRALPAASGSKIIVVDCDLAVADPAAPYQFLAAYNFGDDLHLNTAGHEVLRPLKAAAITAALGL